MLASLTLLAAFFQRTDWLMQLAERAALRLNGGRVVSTLWGVAATVFCLLAAAVLLKILALLGVLALTAGLLLASLGLGTAAVWLGGKISDISESLETDTLPCLRFGLWTLLPASMLPYAGWLLVLLCLAAGIGAVLETLVSRREE